MAGGFARGRRDRRGAAQHGEGGFVAQAVGIGAGGDEQLRSGVGAHTVGRAQRGVEFVDELVECGGEVFGLAFEELDALGQCFASGQYGHRGRIALYGGPASRQCPHQSQSGVAAVAFPQLGGGDDEQGFDLVDRRGAGLDRAAACGEQRAQCCGVLVFRHGQAMAGQRGAGGSPGYDLLLRRPDWPSTKRQSFDGLLI